jgi:hypothetical protein
MLAIYNFIVYNRYISFYRQHLKHCDRAQVIYADRMYSRERPPWLKGSVHPINEIPSRVALLKFTVGKDAAAALKQERMFVLLNGWLNRTK